MIIASYQNTARKKQKPLAVMPAAALIVRLHGPYAGIIQVRYEGSLRSVEASQPGLPKLPQQRAYSVVGLG